MKMNLIDFKGEREKIIVFLFYDEVEMPAIQHFDIEPTWKWIGYKLSRVYVDLNSFFCEKVKCANCNFGFLLPFFFFSHNVC